MDATSTRLNHLKVSNEHMLFVVAGRAYDETVFFKHVVHFAEVKEVRDDGQNPMKKREGALDELPKLYTLHRFRYTKGVCDCG